MIRFDTSEYRFSHGREPRGFGVWIFQIGNSVDSTWLRGHYRQAKAAAKRLAHEIGATFVKVCP